MTTFETSLAFHKFHNLTCCSKQAIKYLSFLKVLVNKVFRRTVNIPCIKRICLHQHQKYHIDSSITISQLKQATRSVKLRTKKQCFLWTSTSTFLLHTYSNHHHSSTATSSTVFSEMSMEEYICYCMFRETSEFCDQGVQ